MGTQTTQGATDVITFLIAQHEEIRDLFTEVASSTGDARRAAFSRLVKLLAVHETAEEQVIRPLTRAEVTGGDEIAAERLAEEQEAKELLVGLERIGPDADLFPPMLETLRIAVLQHARSEEVEEFPYLKASLGDRAEVMTALVRAAEAVAPTHPHPGVDSATASTVAGPFLSLFDRTRDLVRKALQR